MQSIHFQLSSQQFQREHPQLEHQIQTSANPLEQVRQGSQIDLMHLQI